MSLGEGGDQGVEFETISGRDWPTVTQFSVFLENRVGQLPRRSCAASFNGSKVKIVGLSISDSADCCIIRLMLSHPEQGREILERNKLPFAENELLVAELHSGPQSLVDLCSALLQAEINIHYAYPLIVHPHGRAAVAMHIENTEFATNTLREKALRDPLRGRPLVVIALGRRIATSPSKGNAYSGDPFAFAPDSSQALAAARISSWSKARPRASSSAIQAASAASSPPSMRGRGDRTTVAWATEDRPPGERAVAPGARRRHR